MTYEAKDLKDKCRQQREMYEWLGMSTAQPFRTGVCYDESPIADRAGPLLGTLPPDALNISSSFCDTAVSG